MMTVLTLVTSILPLRVSATSWLPRRSNFPALNVKVGDTSIVLSNEI